MFAGGAMFALIASLVGDNIKFSAAQAVLAGLAWAVVVGSYFVLFGSTAGQAPGMRTMGLRVIDARGFLPVLVDDRRRALQDFMASTTVIYDTP